MKDFLKNINNYISKRRNGVLEKQKNKKVVPKQPTVIIICNFSDYKNNIYRSINENFNCINVNYNDFNKNDYSNNDLILLKCDNIQKALKIKYSLKKSISILIIPDSLIWKNIKDVHLNYLFDCSMKDIGVDGSDTKRNFTNETLRQEINKFLNSI